MSDNIKRVLLVGTGNMAYEYIKILDTLNVETIVVGNREESVRAFKEKTGRKAIAGGVENYLEGIDDVPDYAIVAVSASKLYEASVAVVRSGIKHILIEKPAVYTVEQAEELIRLKKDNESEVYIGYNRRFYSSVEVAKKIIEEDGGLMSFNFEFTEWSHVISKLHQPDEIFQRVFLGNSSHVVDLAFYLAGTPKEMASYIRGGLPWHKAGSIYHGCGVTEEDIPFVYQANWEAPGRWGVELLTSKHRLYLRPIEKLQIQDNGSVAVNFYELDDRLDTEYKPGLYNEVRALLYGEGKEKFCTLEEQKKHMSAYAKISGEKY
jgi:predicted dehydrogenase